MSLSHHIYASMMGQYLLIVYQEDLMIRYDGTVRNSAGEVVQFLYGDDGMDGTGVEAQKLDHLKMDDAQVERTYKISLDDMDVRPDWIHPESWEVLQTEEEARAIVRSEFEVLSCLGFLENGDYCNRRFFV